VEALLIEFHNSSVAVTIIIIPVPPKAIPLGIPVISEIMYGNTATNPKNGAPIQLIRFNTLVIWRSVSSPFFTPGINLPDFSKFSAN
jgi:hypothetical protein